MIASNSNRPVNDPDNFDVRNSVRHIVDAVRTYKWTVVFTTMIVLGLVTAYIVFWPPVYTASAMLMVERDTDPVRDSFYLGWNVFRKDDSRTEIELLTSGPVLKEVVQDKDLSYDEVHHSFIAHAAHLWGESWIGRKYREVKFDLLGSPPGDEMPSDAEIELGKTVLGLKSGISLEPVAESNIGRLTVKGPTRDVAEIANATAATYLQRRKERHEEEARRSYDILTEEVARIRDELEAVEQRRVDFLNEHDLAFDFQREASELTKLVDLEESIRDSRKQLAAMKASLAQIDAQLAGHPETRRTSRSFERNSVSEALKMRRMNLQTTLIDARLRFHEQSPEIQDLQRQLAEVEAMMAETDPMVESTHTEQLNVMRDQLRQRRDELVTEVAAVEAALAVMQADAAAIDDRLERVPELQSQLRQLDRAYALAQEKYKEILSKHAQSEVSLITSTAAMPSMRIVERAVTPARKSWPRAKLLYPAGLIIGLAMGASLALLRSYTSSRVRREHLQDRAGDRPLYGSISVSPNADPLVTVRPRKRPSPAAPATSRES